MRIISSYLESVLSPVYLPINIDRAIAILTEAKVEFDAIAVTGNSGTIFGGALAYRMRKPILLVRKPQIAENFHAHLVVEGDIGATSYIFVDDLVSTGGTERRVVEQINSFNPRAKFVGTYLYQQGKYYPGGYYYMPVPNSMGGNPKGEICPTKTATEVMMHNVNSIVNKTGKKSKKPIDYRER